MHPICRVQRLVLFLRAGGVCEALAVTLPHSWPLSETRSKLFSWFETVHLICTCFWMRHCCAFDPQHDTASLVLVSPVPHEGPLAELRQDNQCAMQSSSISVAPYVFSKVCPILTMVLCSLVTDNSGLSTWVMWPVGGTPCSRRY